MQIQAVVHYGGTSARVRNTSVLYIVQLLPVLVSETHSYRKMLLWLLFVGEGSSRTGGLSPSHP